jgi:signal peptidase II
MRNRSLLAFLLVVIACVGCDHASKQLATSLLAGAPAVSLVNDTVRFELAHNPGGLLSLGATLPEALRRLVFVVAVPVGMLAVCVLFLRKARPSRARLPGLALLVGGGLGNWIDRLANEGAVTDFVSLGLGPLRTGIFNLADLAVMGGLALLWWTVREGGGDAPATVPDEDAAAARREGDDA